MQSNCCGNRINESIESGKSGSKCTCPQDYGICEGKPQVKRGARAEDATYAKYLCNGAEKCVVGIDSSDVAPQNFLDAMSTAYFKASAVVKYNKPFDMASDTFDIKITLDDLGKELKPPITFINTRILFSGESSRTELLIAEESLEEKLDTIGSPVTISVPLNLDYKPAQVEESGAIRYVLDYNYIKKVPSGRDSYGNPLYTEEPAREKFTSPPKQVLLVRTG